MVRNKVVLDKSGTVEVEVGKTLQLNATLAPETAKSKLTWKSSSTKVARVDENGKVTGVGSGTATITVKTANGKKDTVKVKVSVEKWSVDLKKYEYKRNDGDRYDNYPISEQLRKEIGGMSKKKYWDYNNETGDRFLAYCWTNGKNIYIRTL